jgi:hypothetical protein
MAHAVVRAATMYRNPALDSALSACRDPAVSSRELFISVALAPIISKKIGSREDRTVAYLTRHEIEGATQMNRRTVEEGGVGALGWLCKVSSGKPGFDPEVGHAESSAWLCAVPQANSTSQYPDLFAPHQWLWKRQAVAWRLLLVMHQEPSRGYRVAELSDLAGGERAARRALKYLSDPLGIVKQLSLRPAAWVTDVESVKYMNGVACTDGPRNRVTAATLEWHRNNTRATIELQEQKVQKFAEIQKANVAVNAEATRRQAKETAIDPRDARV